jgi:hypothetical protein
MKHVVLKQTDYGRVEFSVQETKDLQSVLLTMESFNQENESTNVEGISITKEEYFNLIGTMLFVQSKLKKNER